MVWRLRKYCLGVNLGTIFCQPSLKSQMCFTIGGMRLAMEWKATADSTF